MTEKGIDLDVNDSADDIKTHDIENQINTLSGEKATKKIRKSPKIAKVKSRTALVASVDVSDDLEDIIQAPINCFGLCLRYDKALISIVTFGFQALLGLVVVAFCIGQLASGAINNTEQTVYFTLIGSILGYFLPNPKLDTDSLTSATTAGVVRRVARQ
jgi:hypothetical protein